MVGALLSDALVKSYGTIRLNAITLYWDRNWGDVILANKTTYTMIPGKRDYM